MYRKASSECSYSGMNPKVYRDITSTTVVETTLTLLEQA